MPENSNKNKLLETLKNPKVSRAIYIAVVLMLVAIAIVIGITAASNRTKKPTTNPPAVTTPTPSDTPSAPTTDIPSTDTNDPPTTNETPTVTTPQQSGTVSKPVPTFSLPVSGKLYKYHDAETQVFSNTMNDYRIHLGVDIATSEGAPVYAAADGTVQKIWSDPMMGYCLAVTHSGDSVTVYKNLAKDLPLGIAEGTAVKAGQKIATVGDSAMVEIADEPHLHLEMTVGGLQVDPLEYFSAKDVAALGADQAYGG